jgi:hypothetical protein
VTFLGLVGYRSRILDPFIPNPQEIPTMNLRKLLGAIIASALLFALPVPAAHADTYAPDAVNQDFAGSQGGWTTSAEFSQFCLQQLLCPAVNTTWVAGGADGNGYISTQFATLVETVPGTATGIWQSPAFTYSGLGGKVPGTVTFDMNMMKNLGALLDLSLLNDAQFSVDLVDQGTGVGVSVIPSTELTQNSGWVAIPSVSVNPNLLALGHSYKIRISTSYHAVVTAVALGDVGYDNVRLTTAAADGKGNGGSGVTNIKQLRKLVKNYILPGSMSVEGRFLKVHLRCPEAAAPRPCQIQLQGLQKGKFSKPATARKIVKIKAGKERTVKIRIKPAYLASYKSAKKVWVKCIVRVGKVRVTVRKPIKLRTTS